MKKLITFTLALTLIACGVFAEKAPPNKQSTEFCIQKQSSDVNSYAVVFNEQYSFEIINTDKPTEIKWFIGINHNINVFVNIRNQRDVDKYSVLNSNYNVKTGLAYLHRLNLFRLDKIA